MRRERLRAALFAQPGGLQAPCSHFFMKLALAAPASGLPFAPTALALQAAAVHFFMNAVFAAPVSGLPFLPTAWVSQEPCANAEPAANVVSTAIKNSFFMSDLSSNNQSARIGARNGDAIKFERATERQNPHSWPRQAGGIICGGPVHRRQPGGVSRAFRASRTGCHKLAREASAACSA